MKYMILISLLMAFDANCQVRPLTNAHAHNDYENKRPLFNALENGFISIEADVYLVNHQLYVSHAKPLHLSDSLLLENLYLKPLYKIVNDNGGMVFPGYQDPLLLMIDFKTNSDSTYQELKSLLKPFRSLLCSSREVKSCPVKVFVSGNRPVEKILAEEDGYIALDGRSEDLGKGISATLMPVVSENYEKLNSIEQSKNLSEKERLLFLVMKAHREGKKVRLWGTPDNELTWKFLMDYGVDLINTDKVKEFSLFMRNRYEPQN